MVSIKRALCAAIVVILAVCFSLPATADSLTRTDIYAGWATARANDSGLAQLWDPLPMDVTPTTPIIGDMYNGSNFAVDAPLFMEAIKDAVPDAAALPDPDWDDPIYSIADPINWI